MSAGLAQVALARRAGTSQPALARYESGIVSPSVRTLERILAATGRQLCLSTTPMATKADPRSPRMRKLRSYRRDIHKAARRLGATNIRIFGSVARGEDQPGSDVDVLVDFDVQHSGVLPLIRLRREISDLVGENIDIATAQLLRPDIAQRALAEAVPL